MGNLNEKVYNYPNIWIKNNDNKWTKINISNYLNIEDIYELKIEKNNIFIMIEKKV